MSKLSLNCSICFIVTALMLGCSQQPVQVKSTPQMTYNRIALFAVEEPMYYDVRVIKSDYEYHGLTLPGRIAGLGVTSLMKGLDQGQRNRALTDTVEYWKFKISEQLLNDVEMELKKSGYDVVIVEPEYRRRARFVDDYPSVENVDSYLDLVIDFAGYVALDSDAPYMPTLEVPVKLVSSYDGSIIFAGTFNYGGPIPVIGPKDMPSTAAFNVRSWDELCSTTECEVSPAVRGLMAASEGIAKLVSSNLR